MKINSNLYKLYVENDIKGRGVINKKEPGVVARRFKVLHDMIP